MSKKRGFNASDPTAWKAISWVDKHAAKKDIGPRAKAMREARARLQEQGFDVSEDSFGSRRKDGKNRL
jgi:hypothetical protein